MSGELNITYLVCATPRSGSALLCDGLWNTKIAGQPDEYFNPDYLDKIGIPNGDLSAHCRKIFELGLGSNGVSGVKAMWWALEEFVNRVQKNNKQYKDVTVWRLKKYFPPLKYVWITRINKRRQAISFSRMIQTGVSRKLKEDLSGNDRIPVFDFQQIDNLAKELTRADAHWRQFFKKHNIEPLKIVYEDFIHRYDETLLTVLKFLGVPIPEKFVIPECRLVRQSDAQSEDWLRKYSDIKQHQKKNPALLLSRFLQRQ